MALVRNKLISTIKVLLKKYKPGIIALPDITSQILHDHISGIKQIDIVEASRGCTI